MAPGDAADLGNSMGEGDAAFGVPPKMGHRENAKSRNNHLALTTYNLN
jgi:hypothetical protein